MSKYNIIDNIEEIQQRLCNVISYVLYLYDKKIITERTRDELLKICNPDVYAERNGKTWNKKKF